MPIKATPLSTRGSTSEKSCGQLRATTTTLHWSPSGRILTGYSYTLFWLWDCVTFAGRRLGQNSRWMAVCLKECPIPSISDLPEYVWAPSSVCMFNCRLYTPQAPITKALQNDDIMINYEHGVTIGSCQEPWYGSLAPRCHGSVPYPFDQVSDPSPMGHTVCSQLDLNLSHTWSPDTVVWPFTVSLCVCAHVFDCVFFKPKRFVCYECSAASLLMPGTPPSPPSQGHMGFPGIAQAHQAPGGHFRFTGFW